MTVPSLGASIQRIVSVLVVVAGMTTISAPAAGYVRDVSESGCPYAWASRTVDIHAFTATLSDLDQAGIANAVTQAAEVWTKRSEGGAACTDLDLQVTMMPTNSRPPGAKFDRANNLMFLTDSWCNPVTGACEHDPSALAVTSVFARKWGEIADADIEVNAAFFDWADLVSNPDAIGKQDLQNALTHEMGHVIGLDHTCYSDRSRPRPVDNQGNLILDCNDSSLPGWVRLTTMFPSADPGDISKRTLEPDDQQAVCEAYPRGQIDPLACPIPQQQGGCGVAPDAAANSGAAATRVPLWLGIAAAVLGLAAWTRARRTGARRRR